MNLTNNYNSSNLNRLLDLYLKGINLYQNTPNTDKVNSFFEKSQLLLQSSKAKKVLNENKEKTPEINEIKTDSTLIEENEESDYNNKNKPYEKTYGLTACPASFFFFLHAGSYFPNQESNPAVGAQS